MQSINYSRLAVGKLATDFKLSNRGYEIANRRPKTFVVQSTRCFSSSGKPVPANAIQNSQNFSTTTTVLRELLGIRSSTVQRQFGRNFASSGRHQANSGDRCVSTNPTMSTQTVQISTSATAKSSVQTKTSQLNPPNNEDYYMQLEHTYGAHNYHPLPVVLKVSVVQESNVFSLV